LNRSLSLFWIAIGLGLLVLFGLLYYSSLVTEKKVQAVQETIDGMTVELQQLRSDLMRRSLSMGNPQLTTSLADAGLPSLLAADSFYQKILPGLLPAGFQPTGRLRRGETGRPDDLHPFSAWAIVGEAYGLCGLTVAGMEFGKYGTLSPAMALKIEERAVPGTNRTEYWIHLRDDVYWQPLQARFFPSNFELAPQFLKRHRVTAADFKFWWDALMNPHVQEAGAAALRNYLSEIEEFRVVDEATFVVRWRGEEVVDSETGESRYRVKYLARSLTGSLHPLPCWLYQYFSDGQKIIDDEGDSNAYRTNSVWAQNFSQHWAKRIVPSCGAWIFDGFSDREMTFRRNPDHFEPFAALTDSMQILFRESPAAIWQDFKGGEIDTWDLATNPDKLVELEEFLDSPSYRIQEEKGAPIQRIDYLSRTYSYIGWNMARPLFSSRNTRLAMTLAIDRERIIDRYLNRLGMQLTGPFFPGDSETDPTIRPYPYDPLEAKRLLESEGWYDSDGDGIRDKLVDGRRTKFSFRLTYYVKSTTGRAICDHVATALREIGVECLPTGVDVADLSAAFEGKEFDAIYLGWALGCPPSEPKQLWHSSGAKEKGSSNAVGFASPEVDQAILELQYEADPDRRAELYHRIHRVIYEEQPYTFLVVPKSALLYRGYLQDLFIPAERQDLIPGADVTQPSLTVTWMQSRP
jgi:peptide/nickel transport system substrate-binding protein